MTKYCEKDTDQIRAWVEAGGERDWTSIGYLQELACCESPDSNESPGANYLRRVCDDFLEWVEEYADELADMSADGVEQRSIDDAYERLDGWDILIYTGQIWAAFVDLGGYDDESLADILPNIDGMGGLTSVASAVVQSIGERLWHGLAAEFSEWLRQPADDDGETLF